MHVLITSDTVGGVWTYTQELVTGLAARGHRITLVSFGKLPSTDQAAWLRSLANVDYRPTEYCLEWMEVAEHDIDESRRYLKFLVREVQPDVLHFNQYCYGNVDVDIPRIVVAHSDVISWWVAVHGCEPDNTPWIERYREHVTNGLRAADLVVAPSQWMLDAVTRHYLAPNHGAVIYNGRSQELFDPDHVKEDSVLSVGRIWDEGKHVSLLLQVHQSVSTRIVGWTQEPGREKKALPTCPPNVQLLGPKSQEELRRLYAESAIYIASSRYEPFGLSPLEAALSRCALVMNDIPVFHELWGDAVAYFRKDDPADLSRALGELTQNPVLRNRLANRAFLRACQKFTASRMVAEYESAYQHVASRMEKVA
jgi:glycogen synthase